MAPDAVSRAGKLIIIIGEAANEVGEGATRVGIVASVIKRSVIVKVIMEITLRPANVRAEFESVFAAGPGKSVLVLKSNIMVFGGTLRRRAKVERSRDCNQRGGQRHSDHLELRL